MSKNVIISGAGNIGSRHLQGLATLSQDVHIYVIDPIQASLDLSKERWLETKAPHQVSFNKEMPTHLSHADCVILSCSADARADLARDFLSRMDVKSMIFEKVLFQKPEDYESIKSLLDKSGTKAWVNCVRRIWPIYKEFHNKVNSQATIHLDVLGSNWGMGCNSIHMIDCLGYMVNSSDYKITKSSLDPKIIKSKRAGFYEFTGEFSGEFFGGSTFRIASFAEPDIPYCLTLISQDLSIRVHEDSDYFEERIGNGEWVRRKFLLPFQSQLSGGIIHDILETGDCGLTPFSDSVDLHLPFIEMLLAHYNQVTGKRSHICPIT